VPLPIPCPVQLGSIKGGPLEAELHEYVRQGNYVKVKRLLKKGVFVDAVNSMGQTSLFVAALLGLGKIVDVLLHYHSDANHRCYDGSTPVHAAAFSGNQWILSKLLDAGGDLRVHDENGKNPQYWAMSAGKESSAQMLEFIQRCTLHMQAAIQNFPSDLLRKVGSSEALVYCPSRFGGLVQGNADSPLGKFLKSGASATKDIYSFGFGKVRSWELLHLPFGYTLLWSQFYLAGSGHLGYLASLPIIGEKDVVQADDEAAFSYHVGPYMMMTNLMWGGSRVTVKELSFEPHQNCSKLRLADLLIAEQEHSSKLRHPHLLQLMSVCLSSDLEKTRLVYERVNFGSLYSILHERRTEFPVLHMETILHVLLQISDALRFLHSRGFIHRSLTSYAVQVVSSGEAKLCNLEYMIESKDGGAHSDLTRVPVPVQLYRWCSPEVILEKVVTVKSDIYSFCVVMQEALTETPPWKGFEGSVIKQLIITGHQLEADVRLPMPYYDITKSGLEPRQRNRSMNLQDIQYMMKNDLKDIAKSQTGCAGELSAQGRAVFADVNICLASAFNYQKTMQELQEKETAEADSFTAPRYSLSAEENGALVDQEAFTSLQPVGQDKICDAPSELEVTLSVSDVDDSLCSFEINEIFASFSELQEEILEEVAGSGQTTKDGKRQQKEEDHPASPERHCEEKPAYEEEGFPELSTEYMTEEEEGMSEASDLSMLAQVSRGAGRRTMTSTSPTDQYLSKCVLDLKIGQSMLQEASDSLCRAQEKLDREEATRKQKKLLQETHWNRSDGTSQSTNYPFSRDNPLLWKAIGPPSSVCISALIARQAQGASWGGNSWQAASKTAKEIEAIPEEEWECLHQIKKNKNENHHDLSFSVVESLDDQMSLNHEHLFPHVSVRCKRKLNLQCQRGGDSHSAANGSEEERWCHARSGSEIHSAKISEERRMMQSKWRTEVKQMARRVASGQLELGSPYSASECASESEAESVKEAFQHVTVRCQKSQGQERHRWQTGGNAEPWNLSSEDRSESEESDLESTFRSSGGRSCWSPSQDEEAESGIAIPKDSVLPQQTENLSRGHSRELHCSFNSSSDVSEEFSTPDYFLPTAAQGSSDLAVKITEKAGVEALKLKYIYSCIYISLSSDRMNECDLFFPHCSVEAAQEVTLWEPQEECKEQDVSVTDIQELSSIHSEQNYHRDLDCRTPRVSHAPTSVSTPLGSEDKIPIAFEKYKHYHEVVSEASFCDSQDSSSTVSKTFATAYEEEKSTEIPSVASEVCSPELNEPFTFLYCILYDFTQDGLPVVASPSKSTRKASALSQASKHFIHELPPPAQEMLDETECLKQQDSIAEDLKEERLHGCEVQINVPDQIQMDDRESEEESERNEKGNVSSWTKESFHLAEETERAHSTLDDDLEGMLHAVPRDEEMQQ
ncbi:TEX14 kinase, partial [Eubucco bourcierii]|nr:TEX14 kinase [Eubucco bourcierii]